MRFRVEIEGMPETGVLEVVFPEARAVGRAGTGGRARYGTIFLKRGVTHDEDWQLWWDESRRGRKSAARRVTVTVLDESGENARGWIFRNAKPLAYSVSSLNALGREVLTETLELSVGGFERA
jgi:phage tail-like protein